MPMQLMQTLADAELPLEIVNPAVKEELRILHDAGYIICGFPPLALAGTQAVRVDLVTALGLKALRYFGPDPVRSRYGA